MKAKTVVCLNRSTGTSFLLKLVISLLPILVTLNLSARTQLDWLKFNQIPINIAEGQYKGEGINELILDLFRKEILTDFEIQVLWLNHKRFNVEAKHGNNCYFGWRTFPKYRLFSNPILIWFPMGVIAHSRDAHKFGPPGTVVSLESLLQNQDLRIGLAKVFAYAPGIRRLTKKYADNENIYWEESGLLQSDLRMILNNRIDYTINWPMLPIISESVLGIPNEFVFYNIKEDQKYLYIGISCSKTEAGQIAINRINQLVGRRDILDKIVGFAARWNILSKQWKDLYQQVIIEGKTSPLVVHMDYAE